MATTGYKGRRVRCPETGEYGTSLTFWKAPDGRYYKDEATWQARQERIRLKGKDAQEREQRHIDRAVKLEKERQAKAEVMRPYHEMMDLISYYMGYSPGMVFPTVITRFLKEFSFYGPDVILETLKQNQSALEFAMRTRNFKSDYHRASYLVAILKNKINDVYKDMRRLEQAQQTVPVQEFVQPGQLDSIGTHAQGRDISRFLDE